MTKSTTSAASGKTGWKPPPKELPVIVPPAQQTTLQERSRADDTTSATQATGKLRKRSIWMRKTISTLAGHRDQRWTVFKSAT